MASDSRRNCVGTFVPPPALLCQTSFLLPVRGFAMVGHSAGPNSWPLLVSAATSPAPCSCILLFFLLTGLRYRRVRWDKSHRLLTRGPAHVPLCRLSSGVFWGLPSDKTWPCNVAGCRRHPPCHSRPQRPASMSARRPSCSSVPPPPLRRARTPSAQPGEGGAGGSSPLGTGTRAPTD